MFFILLIATGLSGIIADSKVYEGKESWGYINVRKDAYMFWWLFCKEVDNYRDFPLIIWLQGGPGASSTGYGNFMEIGPYNEYLHPRNTSWVQKANVLFLDNPVGTGYSYVKNKSALATNNQQIAEDLLTTLTSVLQNLPEFQKSPLYIFSESYGGKMTVDFSLVLYEAIKAGKVVCNFKGVALGDSWISPIDSVATWGPYLYTMSLADKTDLKQLDAQVSAIKKSLASGQYSNATALFSTTQDMIEKFTNNVDWYNILKPDPPQNSTLKCNPKDSKCKLHQRHVAYLQDDLTDLMNGKIKTKLHVIPKNVTWGGQSADVFAALTEDFMKPVVESVEKLLNETTLSVNVYSGQLDLIVDFLGTMQWIGNLKWPGIKEFSKMPRVPFKLPNNSTAGFSKSFKNFNFFWILRAGHMVPADAGLAALSMLDMIVAETK